MTPVPKFSIMEMNFDNVINSEGHIIIIVPEDRKLDAFNSKINKLMEGAIKRARSSKHFADLKGGKILSLYYPVGLKARCLSIAKLSNNSFLREVRACGVEIAKAAKDDNIILVCDKFIETAHLVEGLALRAYNYLDHKTNIKTIITNVTVMVKVVDRNKTEINTDTPITINGQEVSGGKISLAEAETIISAGRGLKGPENWGMIEELARVLGAATACSKPVSDIGWRPHSEHVGQTGKAVAPSLYIAIGISGAIQHLAGVNSSKVIVAINTDAEAPFFKAADYGIIGDAFEVVPKLIQEIKNIR